LFCLLNFTSSMHEKHIIQHFIASKKTRLLLF